MSKQKYSMQQVGVLGDSERYMLMPTTAVGGSTTNQAAIEQQYGTDTHFLGSGEVGDAVYSPITVNGRDYEYINYGDDNNMPYELQRLLRMNMIAQRAQAFNVQCCYGQGVRFVDRATGKDTDDAEIRAFCLRNSVHEIFMEQALRKPRLTPRLQRWSIAQRQQPGMLSQLMAVSEAISSHRCRTTRTPWRS